MNATDNRTDEEIVHRLRDQCPEGPSCRCCFNVAADEIERLRARAEAAEADAARYRWLKEDIRVLNASLFSVRELSGHGSWENCTDLDTAIDAARQPPPEGEM